MQIVPLSWRRRAEISHVDLRLLVNIDVGKIIFTAVLIYCLFWL